MGIQTQSYDLIVQSLLPVYTNRVRQHFSTLDAIIKNLNFHFSCERMAKTWQKVSVFGWNSPRVNGPLGETWHQYTRARSRKPQRQCLNSPFVQSKNETLGRLCQSSPQISRRGRATLEFKQCGSPCWTNSPLWLVSLILSTYLLLGNACEKAVWSLCQGKGWSGEERGGAPLNGSQIHIERSHICILSAGPR